MSDEKTVELFILDRINDSIVTDDGMLIEITDDNEHLFEFDTAVNSVFVSERTFAALN